jgi:hypothetical protein
VKPANILLENSVERVKITDFGLALAVDDASLTHSGFIAGTPQYIAPEQAKGEATDHRADLFSLGSVLYAMCTGRPPFRAETTLAVLRRICEEPARPVREVNPDVPAWLAEFIEKLHAKGPAERFHSAAEVADLLGRYLAHLQQPSVVPMPPRVRPLSSRPRPRGRAVAMVAALVVLVAASGFAVNAWFQGHAPADRVDDPPAANREEAPRVDALLADAGFPREDPMAPEIAAVGEAVEQYELRWSSPSPEPAAVTWTQEINARLESLERDVRSPKP